MSSCLNINIIKHTTNYRDRACVFDLPTVHCLHKEQSLGVGIES